MPGQNEVKDGVLAVSAQDSTAWRRWLEKHHLFTKSVWLIIYKKDSDIQSITYDQAVDDALCFGWVDSKPNKRDDKSFYQYFAKRHPKSNWSLINKEKVARLAEAGKMHPSGMAMVEEAKISGNWDALNDVENLVIPKDLAEALTRYESAAMHFENFPRSVKKGILEWILNAKRPETRNRRIVETARLADQNIRANQYR